MLKTKPVELTFAAAAAITKLPEAALRHAAEHLEVASPTTGTLGALSTEARKIIMQDEGLNPVEVWRATPGGRSPEGVPSAAAPRGSSKVRLLWASQTKGIGTAYGISTHANMMRRELEKLGVLTYDPNESFDLAVHFVQPELFRPIPGKKNLLFCTCEMSEPTEPMTILPDLMVVPCQFNRDVFSCTFDGPIEVAGEGVDPSVFSFHERRPTGPNEKFRFLFCGNVDDSTKGFGLFVSAVETWRKSGRMPSNVEIYAKTTGLQAPPPWLDNRDLPVHELAVLYNSAHALVSPSMGEGWNLVLSEALSTGAPAIWTHHTAMLDYLDENVGFPITEFKPHVFRDDMPGYFGLAADESAIIARMEEVYHNYGDALERGRRASERMHSRYTWHQAAEKFLHICERHA